MATTRKKSVPRKQSPLKTKPQKVNKPKQPWLMNLINDIFWLLALMITLFIILSLASFDMTDPAWSRGIGQINRPHNLAGLTGAWLADIGYYIFGLSVWWSIIAAIIALYKSFRPLNARSLNTSDDSKPYNSWLALTGLFVLLIFSPAQENLVFASMLQNALPIGAGGLIGQSLGNLLHQFFGLTGGLIISIFMILIGLSLLLQVSWLTVIEKLGAQCEWFWCKLLRRPQRLITEFPNNKTVRQMVKQAKNITARNIDTPELATSNRKAVTVRTEPTIAQNLTEPAPASSQTAIPAKSENDLIQLPDVKLLSEPTDQPAVINSEFLQQTAAHIESRLKEFGVAVEVTSATTGPVITRYEIEPAQGVKGSQIVNLNKDLARSLSVQSVRIVETIAGKTTMGIELPNDERQSVLLAEILGAKIFHDATDKLTMAMGKDIAGAPVIASLAKMPHLLVAGTTGSGKSVGVNCMILSILYKAQPDEVRFIMVDPKMLELSVYDGIPHLLAPVVTDMKEAAQALNWCVTEMEKRYRLLAHVGVRNINGFNDKVAAAKAASTPLVNPFSTNPDEPEPLDKLPYIVVVIDELADLMMVEGKKVEQQIARLAQKARAAGIHLILATQRPSVDVITGLIKANIPTRLSFQVSSKIDSRTILDQMGAENLLGKGDMLFLPPGQAEPTRLHGAFVPDEEVHAVVNFIKQQAPTQYVEGILSGEAAQTNVNQVNPNANSDELFDQAVAFVLETRKTSISSLQRHLRIGYNRAANLMEALEAAGIVSAAELGGSRRILAQKDNL
ncbi:cell division protein FtsK [Snodgrassella alvi]|jgi:DNA segregation ATPase FtsK/SpoIIIE, S-DNA-T family|uniref:DNA translocase FtsK n=1 Tax=Snodgrassella alvi TaxID=1196083 RepID=UPI000C1ED73F|nr:DNA translocase FtsK [Snodgrassella alvi]PIT14759.1 cell division protein FtsK [Snodgrassella alvi]PIT55184.1 cell division protein FtsK [Snodgrassella alvi]